MIRIERGLAGAWLVAAMAAFACSSDPPEKPPDAHAGSAGKEATDHGDSGASDGGRGNIGGGGAAKSGSGSTSAEAGADPGGPDGAGGDSGEGGARDAGGEAGEGHIGSGGAPGGAGTGAKGNAGAGGGLFVINAPSAECQAGPAVSTAPSPVAGLLLPPSSGHKCDATYEPNDSDGQACQLALGALVPTQLSGATDQTDNFVFHAEAGVKYTLLFSTINCGGGSNYVAVSARSLGTTGQTQLLSRTAYFGTRSAYEIQSNTTADALLTFATGLTCQYEFQVVQSTAQGLMQDAGYEPNDSPSTASMLELDHLVSPSLSGPSDMNDYFTVPVQANVTYSVHVSTENCSGGSNYISLSGSSLGSGAPVLNMGPSSLYFGGDYDSEFTTTTSGLELLSLATGLSCEYKLYVLPSTICGLGHNANYEPNNTPSTAAPIAVDQPVHGEVQSPSDTVDYYVFSVTPNAKYTLNLSTAACVGGSNYLNAQLWSGQTEGLNNGFRSYYYGQSALPLEFTTGSATQELLAIKSGSPCGYELSISKN